MNLPKIFTAGAALALALLTPAADAQQAPAKGKTIIVFDGSGSMWGQISGTPKIDIAKKAVSDLVSTLDPATSLGLMAYGHRRKGDCEDIELLVPAAPNSQASILKAVGDLVPKGKTPLCDAVLMAATSLTYEEEKATVILISDGIETCGKDPCAVGDALAARGIDFVCHVIGFDLSADEKVGLECLANKTGGLYLDARDANTLRDSLNKAVEAVVVPETHLILAARSAAGDLLSGVNFSIYGPAASETPLHTGAGGKFRQKLEPGAYSVTAKFGDSLAEGKVEVPEGVTTNFELQFQATGLRANAVLVEGGEPIAKDLSWRLYKNAPGSESRPGIGYSYDAQPTFHLSPGTYYIAATRGSATAEKQVEVVGGQATSVTVVLGSGFLVATASMTKESEPLTKELSWTVYSQPDAEGDRAQVTYSYDSKPRFVVPAGTYLLQVKYGNSAAQLEVTISGGETTEVALSFGAGTIAASAVMNEGSDPVAKEMAWTVYGAPDAEGKRPQAAYSYDQQPKFKLPSGIYTVEAKRGAVTRTEEVVVNPGETNNLVVNLRAGILAPKAFMGESSGENVTKDLSWTILGPPNSEGNRAQVTYSYDTAPRFYLGAGKYLLQVKRNAASFESEINVAPGKYQEEKVVLNAGLVLLKGPANATGQSWTVQRLDGEGNRVQVTYSYDKEFRTALPAREFIVVLKAKVGGEAKSFETKITVAAGQFSEITVGP